MPIRNWFGYGIGRSAEWKALAPMDFWRREAFFTRQAWPEPVPPGNPMEQHAAGLSVISAGDAGGVADRWRWHRPFWMTRSKACPIVADRKWTESSFRWAPCAMPASSEIAFAPVPQGVALGRGGPGLDAQQEIRRGPGTAAPDDLEVVENGDGSEPGVSIGCRYGSLSWIGWGQLPPDTSGCSLLPRSGRLDRVHVVDHGHNGFGFATDGGYDVWGVTGRELPGPDSPADAGRPGHDRLDSAGAGARPGSSRRSLFPSSASSGCS